MTHLHTQRELPGHFPLLFLAILLAAITTGCGKRFTGCEAYLNCPLGGAGGTTGDSSGGTGGGALPPSEGGDDGNSSDSGGGSSTENGPSNNPDETDGSPSTPKDCGNGAIDEGEDCDDGEENSDTKTGCSTRCTLNECEPGRTRSCASDGAIGNCASGTQVCVDGVWGQCSVQPRDTDSCSPGDDANCNGVANEGCACVEGSRRSCAAGGALGNCATGEQECLAGGVYGPCSIAPAAKDSCTEPNDDANCDGTPNGGCPCIDGQEAPCGPTDPKGICRRGVSRCVNSVWTQCDAVYPKERDCTSPLDNDCDGTPDDTIDSVCTCAPNAERTCDEHPGKDGKGPCKAGRQQCTLATNKASSTWSACTGAVAPAAADSCATRGNDANCDGSPNGGCTCISGDTTTCGAKYASTGDCAAHALTCTTAGTWPASSACVKTEVCDGLDNDCDGLVDLADGVGLGGAATSIPNRAWADIAWSTTAQNFGFVAQQSLKTPSGVQSGIYFGTVSQNGQVMLRNGSVSTPDSNEMTYGRPRIAWSPVSKGYGIVYPISESARNYGAYSLLDNTGSRMAMRGLKSGGAITGRANGDFVVLQDPSTGWVLGLAQGQTYTELETNPVIPVAVSITSTGDSVAVLLGTTFVHENGTKDYVLWVPYNWNATLASFENGPELQVSTAGRNPDGIGMPGGYAFTVATAAGAYLATVSSSTWEWGCTATLEFGNNVLDADDAVAIERTAYGLLVLATDAGSGKVQLFRVGDGCEILDQAEVRANAVGSRAPSIAVGGGKVALSWTEVSGSAAQGYVRVIDEQRLCQ